MLLAAAASARAAPAADAPIRLAWSEGDVAGMTSIYAAGGSAPIGYVEYRQTRRGDLLSAVRVARFADGSSDEDRAEAAVGATLRALRGRTVIRDTSGRAIVDLAIDVAGGRLSGFWRDGDEEHPFDERVELPPDTYWGPLVFLALKNFDANATDGVLRFRTVVPIPRPFVLDLELVRRGPTLLRRAGSAVEVQRFDLRPAVHWAIDPVLRLFAPDTRFLVHRGAPPALARFAGPRNFSGQEIRIE